jgi:hypothetical protein
MKQLILILAFIAPLAAQSICPTGVTHCGVVSWTCPTGSSNCAGTGDPVTGFHVWRATSCAAVTSTTPAVPYAVISSPSTYTYTDLAVVAGNSFCYGVTAFNAGGDGPLAVGALGTAKTAQPVVSPGVSSLVQ